MRHTVAFTAALLMLASADATASKCAARFFELSGTVTDITGQPIPGALVGVSWRVEAAPRGPALALANPLGQFSIPVRIAPLKCSTRSFEFSVSAYTPTHHSQYEIVVASPGVSAITVPPLRVVTEIHRAPVWPDEAGG